MAKSPEERRAAWKRWYSKPENKEKKKARDRAWRAANPEKDKAIRKAWRDKNPEKIRARAKAWYDKNTEKAIGYTEKWQRDNRDKYLAACRATNRKRKKYSETDDYRAYNYKLFYDITIQEYDQMMKDQKGLCAICLKPEVRKRRLSVDHCHNSKKVRGLLCSNCNTMIGLAKDSAVILKAAAKYITCGDKLKKEDRKNAEGDTAIRERDGG